MSWRLAVALLWLVPLMIPGGAHIAWAEDLPDYVRTTAEQRFLAGRFQDLPLVLDSASTPKDVFPLVLAMHWWRRTPEAKPAVVTPAATTPAGRVDAERLGWARAGAFEPPYPRQGSGGAGGEPYPLLTALIDDRVRRESHGAAGLPEDGPLAAYLKRSGGGRSRYETADLKDGMAMMIRSYRGDEDPANEFRLDRAARALHDRNRLLYLTSLAAFMVLSFVGLLLAGRRSP